MLEMVQSWEAMENRFCELEEKMMASWQNVEEWVRSALGQQDPAIYAQLEALRSSVEQLQQDSQRWEGTLTELGNVCRALELSLHQHTQGMEARMQRLERDAQVWSASLQSHGVDWQGHMEMHLREHTQQLNGIFERDVGAIREHLHGSENTTRQNLQETWDRLMQIQTRVWAQDPEIEGHQAAHLAEKLRHLEEQVRKLLQAERHPQGQGEVDQLRAATKLNFSKLLQRQRASENATHQLRQELASLARKFQGMPTASALPRTPYEHASASELKQARAGPAAPARVGPAQWYVPSSFALQDCETRKGGPQRGPPVILLLYPLRGMS